jgi:hypothetical protein
MKEVWGYFKSKVSDTEQDGGCLQCSRHTFAPSLFPLFLELS